MSKKIKQFLAIGTVVIIIGLYITTLVLAIMDNSYTERFFQASLFSSVFLPVMLYLMIWISNVLKSYNPYNEENKTTPPTNDDIEKK